VGLEALKALRPFEQDVKKGLETHPTGPNEICYF